MITGGIGLHSVLVPLLIAKVCSLTVADNFGDFFGFSGGLKVAHSYGVFRLRGHGSEITFSDVRAAYSNNLKGRYARSGRSQNWSYVFLWKPASDEVIVNGAIPGDFAGFLDQTILTLLAGNLTHA